MKEDELYRVSSPYSRSLLDLEEKGSQLTQKFKQQYGRLVEILELSNFLLICLT
ncbi:hypothetical protein RND71_007339 [Anisodus tanguticus]|uniref:Uncharacterized protein n=1 Tax=Anisodus tanguticus TaxID=243964 RepID=A0AAE1SL75_9SOLA|nr:hypothetical protein RND71_007339 [Anisodus tanguticus]